MEFTHSVSRNLSRIRGGFQEKISPSGRGENIHAFREALVKV
jgi:hypothetical protein